MKKKPERSEVEMKEAGNRLTKAIRAKYKGRDWLDQFCTALDLQDATTSKTMIIKYKKGEPMLPVDKAKVFAKILGVTPEYLLVLPPKKGSLEYEESLQKQMREYTDKLATGMKEKMKAVLTVLGVFNYNVSISLDRFDRQHIESDLLKAVYELQKAFDSIEEPSEQQIDRAFEESDLQWAIDEVRKASDEPDLQYAVYKLRREIEKTGYYRIERYASGHYEIVGEYGSGSEYIKEEIPEDAVLGFLVFPHKKISIKGVLYRLQCVTVSASDGMSSDFTLNPADFYRFVMDMESSVNDRLYSWRKMACYDIANQRPVLAWTDDNEYADGEEIHIDFEHQSAALAPDRGEKR